MKLNLNGGAARRPKTGSKNRRTWPIHVEAKLGRILADHGDHRGVGFARQLFEPLEQVYTNG